MDAAATRGGSVSTGPPGGRPTDAHAASINTVVILSEAKAGLAVVSLREAKARLTVVSLSEAKARVFPSLRSA
jgi:uncharacterized membrane protein YqjE